MRPPSVGFCSHLTFLGCVVECEPLGDHVSRIQTLVQQEQNSHDQLMRLQHDVAAAQGQVLASDTILRNQQRVVNEIEHESNDRVSRLEAEVRDAAHEASMLQPQGCPVDLWFYSKIDSKKQARSC